MTTKVKQIATFETSASAVGRNPAIKEINFPKNGSVVLGRSVAHSSRGFYGEWCTHVPDRIMLDRRFSGAARFFAGWAWGQAITWVFSVEDIQARLGYTRANWRTLSKELTELGFLKQWTAREECQSDGPPVHLFRLDFRVFQGDQPTCPQEGQSSAILSDWSKSTTREGSISTPRARAEKQPLAGAVEGSHLNNNLKNKHLSKQQQQLVVDNNAVDQGKAVRPSVAPTGADAVEVAVAVGSAGGGGPWEKFGFSMPVLRLLAKDGLGASTDQMHLAVGAFGRAVKSRSTQVDNKVGLARHLAREAAAGQLIPVMEVQCIAAEETGASADAWSSRRSFAGWIADHPGWGRIKVEHDGRVWRQQTGGCISGADGLALWKLVEAGKLRLHRPADEPA